MAAATAGALIFALGMVAIGTRRVSDFERPSQVDEQVGSQTERETESEDAGSRKASESEAGAIEMVVAKSAAAVRALNASGPVRSSGQLAVVFVAGMDCKDDPAKPNDTLQKRLQNILSDARYYAPAGKLNVHAMCDVEASGTLVASQNILGCLAGIAPQRREPYVLACTRKVAGELVAGHTVVLLGRSYGGAVTSMVVRSLLAGGVDVSRLYAQTMGSSYIPAQHLVKGAKLRHVVGVADMVTRCNDALLQTSRSIMRRWRQVISERNITFEPTDVCVFAPDGQSDPYIGWFFIPPLNAKRLDEIATVHEHTIMSARAREVESAIHHKNWVVCVLSQKFLRRAIESAGLRRMW